jgi:hypothetical protein
MEGDRIMRAMFGVLVLTVCASLLPGCASTPAPADVSAAAEPCDGRALLVVRNRAGEVEIVETRRGSGARTVVAIVGSGFHELPIRAEPDYRYYARPIESRRVLARLDRDRVDSAVSLERICRRQESSVSSSP